MGVDNKRDASISYWTICIIIGVALGLIIGSLSFPFLLKFDIFNSNIPEAKALGQPTLVFIPASSTVALDQTFPVDINLNTDNENIVAVSAYINYDPNFLEATSIDTSSSAFTKEAESRIDVAAGKIYITRGEPTPGINGSSIFVGRVYFKTLITGKTSISFDFNSFGSNNDSAAILDDGLGTDILKQVASSEIMINTIVCQENWSCADWNTCINGEQTRICTDLNNCSTGLLKPIEKISCAPIACLENWTCTNWSSCTNSSQTRICTDQNKCGTISNQPQDVSSCPSPIPPINSSINANINTNSNSNNQINNIDTVAPNTKISNPNSRKIEFNTIKATWEGLDDKTTPTQLKFSYRLDNAPWSPEVIVLKQELPNILKGGHTLEVRAIDEAGNIDPTPANYSFIVDYDSGILAAQKTGDSKIRIFDKNNKFIREFTAFEDSFKGGVSIVAKDLGEDGTREIIVSSGKGRTPEVKLFRLNGAKIDSFAPYSKNFKGGVNIAVGDFNGDNRQEIATATQSGTPQVRIFGFRNKQWQSIIPNFQAFTKTSDQGVNISAADINGDNIDELIIASNSGSEVKVFGLKDKKMQLIAPVITPYGKNFKGGVNISAGDLNGDNKDEIITSPVKGSAQILTYSRNADGKLTLVNPGFYAFDKSLKIGAFTSVYDANADGVLDIIVTSANEFSSIIKIFSAKGVFQKEFKSFSQEKVKGLKTAIW